VSAFIDLIGEKFGVLEVLDFHSVKHTHARWNCLCHNCYSLTDIPSNNLKIGEKNYFRECAGSVLNYKYGLEIMIGLEEGKTKKFFTKNLIVLIQLYIQL